MESDEEGKEGSRRGEGSGGACLGVGRPPGLYKLSTLSDLCEEDSMLRRDHTLRLYICVCVLSDASNLRGRRKTSNLTVY